MRSDRGLGVFRGLCLLLLAAGPAAARGTDAAPGYALDHTPPAPGMSRAPADALVIPARAGDWSLRGSEASLAVMRQPAEPEAIPPAPGQPASFWRGWNGSVEAGLNGSDGNSESLDIRAGLNLDRKTARMETTFRSEYSYATSDGQESKNRWFNELRNDWLFGGESRWSFFLLGQLEYDGFSDWDWRVSVFAGPGYKLIKTDKTSLNLRAGGGVTRYFGGEMDDLVPEGLLAADLAHQLTERQKLTAGVEYYPSFEELSRYRLVARVGWEIVVDPEVNMMLKLGVEDRYNSDPGEGFKKNDIDFFALIGWKF